MSLSVFDLSVPILVRQLEQLSNVIKKAEQHLKENGKDAESLLQAKIADDMLPLTFQVQTCCNTAKGVLFRIGGEENVNMEDNEKSLAELYTRIEKTVSLLRAAKREKFIAPTEKCTVKMGPHTAEFEALAYLQKFCLPNFFFHFVTAYDILRKEGVPVGKQDYLGAGDLVAWSL